MIATALDQLAYAHDCAIHYVHDDVILFEIVGPTAIIIVNRDGTFEIIER